MTIIKETALQFGGEPDAATPPVQVIVMGKDGVVLTKEQYADIAKAYKDFTRSYKVSVSPSMVHNGALPDGTPIKLEHQPHGDRVFAWPSANEEDLLKTLSFYCIPFDESYISAQHEDTYVLTKVPKKAGASLLDDLKKLKNFLLYPSTTIGETSKASHPGNQTWYANAKQPDGSLHKHYGYVLSWWGQANRYHIGRFDQQIPTGKAWANSVSNTSKDWWDGTDTGMVCQPYVTNVYEYAVTHSTKQPLSGATTVGNYIWMNGLRAKLDFAVYSACVGERVITGNTKSVLRIYSGSGNAPKIYEMPLDQAVTKILAGDPLLLASFTAFDLPGFAAGIGVEEVTYMIHPPYWNADGTEAAGLLATVVTAGNPALGGAAAYKILCPKDAAPSFQLIVASSYTKTGSTTTDYTGMPYSTSRYDHPVGYRFNWFNGGLSYAESHARTVTARKPIAVDYVGNELQLVEVEYTETGSGSITATNVATANPNIAAVRDNGYPGTSHWVNPPYSEDTWSGSTTYYPLSYSEGGRVCAFTERELSAQNIVQNSRLLLNNVEIDTTTSTYTYTASVDVDKTADLTDTSHPELHVNDYGGGVSMSTVWIAGVITSTLRNKVTSNASQNRTGVCADYAIAAGDLRAKSAVFSKYAISSVTPYVRLVRTDALFHRSLYAANIVGSYSINNTSDVMWVGTKTRSTYAGGVVEAIQQATQNHTVTGSGSFRVGADEGSYVLYSGGTGVVELFKACDGDVKYFVGDVTNFQVEPYDTNIANMLTYQAQVYMATSPNDTTPYNISNVVYKSQNMVEGHIRYTTVREDGSFTPASFTPYTMTKYDAETPPAGRNYIFAHDYSRFTMPQPSTFSVAGEAVQPYYAYSMENLNGSSAAAFTATGGGGNYWGAGAPQFIAHASSASAPDGSIVYLGLTTTTLINPVALNDTKTLERVVENHDIWLMDGTRVTPSKPYPYNGTYKNLSAPVFAGPIPKSKAFK